MAVQSPISARKTETPAQVLGFGWLYSAGFAALDSAAMAQYHAIHRSLTRANGSGDFTMLDPLLDVVLVAADAIAQHDGKQDEWSSIHDQYI